LRAQI